MGEVGFVLPSGHGVVAGRTRNVRVVQARRAQVVMAAGREQGWWRKVQAAAFAAVAGIGISLTPVKASVRTEALATTTTEKAEGTDIKTLFVVGGAVLGVLALKKKIEEMKESKDIERRAQEQRELYQEGKAPILDLREIEQRQRTEEEMSKLDADRDTTSDDPLMKELRKRMEKLQKNDDPDAEGDGDDDDPNNRPGADGRIDRNSRGNTGSATLDPPSGDGSGQTRPRRPIQRPRRANNDPRSRRASPPPGRHPQGSQESQNKGGTLPRDGDNVPADNVPADNVPADGQEGEASEVSKEQLEMLKRMWDLSGDSAQEGGDKGKK